MILEVAMLQVRDGLGGEFEQAFERARSIIASMTGHLSLQLQRCLEVPDKYVLLVEWNRLEDHTVGFRVYRGFKRQIPRSTPCPVIRIGVR